VSANEKLAREWLDRESGEVAPDDIVGNLVDLLDRVEATAIEQAEDAARAAQEPRP